MYTRAADGVIFVSTTPTCAARTNRSSNNMFRVLALAALFCSASAFRAMPRTARGPLRMAALDEMAGVSEELGGKVWDPLNFGSVSDQSPELATLPHVKWLREAELKHGRICMLAFVGVLTTASGAHFPVYPEVTHWTDAFAAACKENPVGMSQIFLAIAIAEGQQFPEDFWTGGGNREAGDIGLDIFRRREKTSKEAMDKLKLQELKNGRAAMICMAAFASAELIPGSVPPFNLLHI